jgi:cytochrome c oxidase subunit II
LPRSTLIRLFAAMVVLTIVMAVPLTLIHWNGPADSTQAGPIDTLLNVMIVLSCFVFSIVLVMLGYCLWKYRAKPGDESDGEPIHGNTRLEIAWTVIPTIIVLFGAVYSAFVLADIEKKDPNRMVVGVVGQQYKWSFAYTAPGGGIVHSDVLNVPDNRELELHLASIDVIHSFWVPEWRIKRDVVPAGPSGNDVDSTVVVTPDRLGTYNVVCTELCGYGHAAMRALVHVWPQERFNTWLSNQARIQKQTGGPSFPTLNPGSGIPGETKASGSTSAPSATSTTGGG